MSGQIVPVLWCQVAGAGSGGPTAPAAAGNPASMALLAFRRWSTGLTLGSPDPAPGMDGLNVLLVALAALFLTAIVFQGVGRAFVQLLDVRGHLGLVRAASRRVWGASWIVAAMIAFTVFSWTGGLTVGYLSDRADRWKNDMALISRTRSPAEMAVEQGSLAAMTPLRDVAGLGDNLPLLALSAYMVLRAASGLASPALRRAKAGEPRGSRPHDGSGWATLVWGCGSLYALYRIVSKASGTDLPLGGCLMIEAVLIPLIMLICDGFLLAWLLTELRDADLPGVNAGDSHFRPFVAMELLPASAIGCLAALPARYAGTLVFLALQHLPRSFGGVQGGRTIRWLLGWGMIEMQGASLLLVGLVGVAAWSRGAVADLVHGGARLLREEGGHLVATLALAAAAMGLTAGLPYAILLFLPPAGWVLPAADSYSHYATLPVGLWTLSALIELARRTLPVAREMPEEPGSDPAEGPGEGRESGVDIEQPGLAATGA
ncbi:hypothetical protein [Aquisphaera insulae]|uniref:hypothetical protein n=1 Tax=Aquisphaera insulae TaxID=2712864 RepID=UPI0013EE3400|nr:hypothetical protein [Aquisphaera insulae]